MDAKLEWSWERTAERSACMRENVYVKILGQGCETEMAGAQLL